MPAAVSIPMAAGQHQRQQHHRRMSSAGSPMSFKMASSYGSYGRPAIYPGACSPSQLLGPLDVPDFMMALSTSLESTSISDSQHRPRPELSTSFKRYAYEHLAYQNSDVDFCRNYQCCGLALNDLHALVEHFEEVHVQVILDDEAGLNSNPVVDGTSNGGLDANGSAGGAFQLDEDDIDMDLEEEDSSESSGSLPGTPNGPVSTSNNHNNNSSTSNANATTAPQYAASWMQPGPSAFEAASVFPASARSAPASRRPSPRTSPLLSTTASDASDQSLTMPPTPSPDSPTYLSTPFSATSLAFAFASHSPYASGPSTPLASGASTPVRSEYFSYASSMLGSGGAGTTPPASATSHHHPLSLGSYINFQQVQRSHSLPAGTLGLGPSTSLLNGHSPLTPFADSPYSAAESAFGDIDGPTHTLNHHHAHHHHHALHHHHQQAFAQYNLHHSHHHHNAQSPLMLGGDSPLGGDSLAEMSGEQSCVTPASLIYSSNSTAVSTATTPVPANAGGENGSLPPTPTVKVSKSSTKSAEALLKEGGVMMPSGYVLTPERAERLAQLERGVERTDRAPPGTKPFRCPTPMCTKSYKQANGLKYHITHGQCSFLPPDPELGGLSDREADERMRPFVCAVGNSAGGKGGGVGCGRRYKNMNGLRYHYQHSGAHGAAGLAMLAAGTHPQPTIFPKSGPSSAHHHRSSDPNVSTTANNADGDEHSSPIAGGSRSQPASRPGSSQGKVRTVGAQRGTSATRASRSPGTASASSSRPPSRAASVMAHYAVPVPMVGVGMGVAGLGIGVGGVGMDFSHHQPYGATAASIAADRLRQHQQPYGAESAYGSTPYGAQFEMEFGLAEGTEEAGAPASQQQASSQTNPPTYLMGTTSVVPTTAMPISAKNATPTTAAQQQRQRHAIPIAAPISRAIPPMKSSSSSLAGALDLATSVKK